MMMSSTTPPTTESRQLTVDEEQKLYEESARQIAEKVRRQQLGEETNVLPPSASDDGYQLTLDEVQALLKGQIASVRARSESTRLYGSSGASSSTGRGDDAAALSKWYLERAKYIPMRLTLQERKLLRLVNSLFSTSTYIDRVDATSATVNSHAKRVNMTIAGVTATLRSLVTMFDYEAGRDSVEGNALEAIRRHQDDIRRVFEIMRRYKIMNPDKFRDSYGKLVFFMQDCSLPAVREILEFDVVAPIRTVHDVLEESGMLAALTHEQTATATMEIVNYRDETGQEEFTKEEIRKQVKSKELALELIAKSCTKDDASSSSSLSNASARSYYYYSYYQPYKNKNKSDDDDDDGGGGDDDDDGNGAPKRKPKRRLTKEDVKQCLYSVGDNASYLNSNCKPIDDMIAWLKRFFAPDPHTGGPPGGRGGRGSVAVAEDRSLEIRGGVDGSRLTHDHARQFNYVLQTLSLWREILHEVFRLWMLAEQDLLDPASPYKWRDTGQGFHRQQDAPRINKAMHGILYLVQQVGFFFRYVREGDCGGGLTQASFDQQNSAWEAPRGWARA